MELRKLIGGSGYRGLIKAINFNRRRCYQKYIVTGKLITNILVSAHMIAGLNWESPEKLIASYRIGAV